MNDHRDNDCDGRVDEEVCLDGEDFDYDGVGDEDCASIIISHQPDIQPQPGKNTCADCIHFAAQYMHLQLLNNYTNLLPMYFASDMTMPGLLVVAFLHQSLSDSQMRERY